MKKKKTLSTQLTFVISFIVLLIVGVFWMANNTLLEKYYVYNKEKEMLAVYKMVDLAAKKRDSQGTGNQKRALCPLPAPHRH